MGEWTEEYKDYDPPPKRTKMSDTGKVKIHGKEWYEVPSCPGYFVTKEGDIGSFRVLKPSKNIQTGYMCLHLGRKKARAMHRLVLETFKGPSPKGFTGSHLNGNRQDNSIENLEWESRKDNCARQKGHGTLPIGEKRHNARLTEAQIVAIRNEPFTGYGFFTQLAGKYGVHPNTVECAWKRRTWRHI